MCCPWCRYVLWTEGEVSIRVRSGPIQSSLFYTAANWAINYDDDEDFRTYLRSR